eukprot:3749555-Pleurochrysis_carterae.AAC.2
MMTRACRHQKSGHVFHFCNEPVCVACGDYSGFWDSARRQAAGDSARRQVKGAQRKAPGGGGPRTAPGGQRLRTAPRGKR